MQPEQFGADYSDDVYEQTAINESEHVTGDKNSLFSGLRRCSPGFYQWLIVALAIGVCVGMHASFRNTFKAVL